MVQNQRRHMAIVGAGAALAVVLAGCGETDSSATGPSGPTSTLSRSSGATSTPSSSAATSTTAPPSSSVTPTPSSTDTGKPGACGAADIKVTLSKGGGAAGSYYAPLRFTNTSSTPCVMGGYPGVSYVTGPDAHQVGPPAERVEQAWKPVTLSPGEVVHSSVRFLRVRNYEEPACQPTKVRAVRVYVPGETASTLVPYSGMGCTSNDIPGEQLTVKPIMPGPGGRSG